MQNLTRRAAAAGAVAVTLGSVMGIATPRVSAAAWRASAPAQAVTPPPVFAGYADGYRMAAADHPDPWQGSGHVIFVGCNAHSPTTCSTGAHGPIYDAGALMIDNTTGADITVTNASVTAGSCDFTQQWAGLDEQVPAGWSLILTQTGGPAQCPGTGGRQAQNFDTSEVNHLPGTAKCTEKQNVDPIFHVDVNGHPLTYVDTAQVLNTGGVDPGAPLCGSDNETHGWASVAPAVKPVFTGTHVSFAIPSSPAGHWRLRLTTNPAPSTFLADHTGTSGTLTIPLPDSGCSFRAVVSVQPGGTGPFQFYSAATFVIPGCAQLFWANLTGDQVMEATVKGSSVTVATLVTGQTHPTSVAVGGSRYIYWANAGSGAANGEIKRATLDYSPALHATGQTTLVTGQSPYGMAATSTHIYWANSPFIREVPLAGCPPTCTATNLISGQSVPTGVAVNSTHIYWGNRGSHSIRQAPLSGSPVTDLVGPPDVSFPEGVAVDASHIYWSNHGNMIKRADLPGGGSPIDLVTSSSISGVAVSGSHIFWARAGGINQIWEADKSNGGGAHAIITGQGLPHLMAVAPTR